MTHQWFRIVLLAALLAHSSVVPAVPTDDIDYRTQIKPVLVEKCYSCHGVLKQEGGLRLETLALMQKGGDSGAALVPGDADASLIVERVTADHDSRMPPAEDGAALKPEQVELLKNWINHGAVAPAEDIPQGPREHWAFQRIEKPDVASHNDTAPNVAAGNPIDVLLNRRLNQHGIKSVPPAERNLLIRRLYLNLVGLPPTLQQLHDERPWPEIVDELLASPQHGERWGRHWMDVWRYSDWYGLGAQLRYSQKHIWHWRDWIVNSVNADKGYDQMLHEMLAGDEIAPLDPEVVAATGFLARNYYLFNRTTWLDSTIEHTGKAFLGLTLNCAKCHDHKYDPISHVDYYSFRAIFEPHQVRLDPVPEVTDFEQDGLPRVFDDHLEEETFLHLRGDPLNPDKSTKISARVPLLFSDFQPEVQSVDLPASAYAPTLREYVRNAYLDAAELQIRNAAEELAKADSDLKIATAETANSESPKDPESSEAPFVFRDEFDAANPDNWEIVGGGWKFADGALIQTTPTRESEYLRLQRPMPRDFEVTCQYTTTGGATYKSTTFRFDQSDDLQYANYVYSSAHAPDPKVQVAYSRKGNSVYPAEGRAARPIKVGQTYTLKFAVRDRLVNVWLNDEFVLAYQFPDRRPDGHFSLQAFDATVAFDWIEIRSLSADFDLLPAKSSTSPTSDPQQLVKIASAKLRSAEAEKLSLQAKFAADQAKFEKASAERIAETAQAAAKLEALALVANADAELIQANGDVARVKAANERLAAAHKQLAAAESGSGSYQSLRSSKKALEGPADKESNYPVAYPETSTGRRLALAQWMTSRENPLTARVAVNHVWMRHFGEPLVESVFDFGLRTKRPLHADVLDYLAAEFMESGWSLKHLHRLIVTSQTYQRSCSTVGCDPTALQEDPNNTLYWRMNTRRMESEVVRDSLLQLAGELDLKMGGPSVDVGKNSRRRSVYYKHSRDDQDKFLTMFDNADLLQCYRRSESIVPQQALALANSELAMTAAEAIARRISKEMPEATEGVFVNVAFETLMARLPTSEEHAESLLFCQQLNDLLKSDSSQAEVDVTGRVRVRLIHSLLNHNDFVSVR